MTTDRMPKPGTYPGQKCVHDCTDVFPQFRVDGDDPLRQVSHVLHHPLVTEIIRKQLCPLAEPKQKTKKPKYRKK